MRRVFAAWWPLAASWAFMGLELPALAAVVARLPDAKVHLAAYGGVVFPIALLVESPIIMLLAASTALSRDWASYRRLHRFMTAAGAVLTGLHALIAFTPIFDLVVAGVLGAPEAVREPARIGLRILLPWTWSIAYRRFHQGVLIRAGESRAVGLGTAVRFLANATALGAGWLAGASGIVTAATAVAAGVVAEAAYVGLTVRPALRRLAAAPAVEPPLTRSGFLRFYAPLALTPLLELLMQPIGAAGLARMPRALDSLAVWPVLAGLLFLLKSGCIAYNEVVVARFHEPGAPRELGRFAAWLAAVTSGALALVATTPLARAWFDGVSGLAPELGELARSAIWLGLPLPALAAGNNFLQGVLVASGRTRAIPESLAVFLAATTAVVATGVALGRFPGAMVGLAALAAGSAAQHLWLRRRARPVLASVRAG